MSWLRFGVWDAGGCWWLDCFLVERGDSSVHWIFLKFRENSSDGVTAIHAYDSITDGQ